MIVESHWHIGIGDRSATAWAIVAAYGIVTALCVIAALRSRQQVDSQPRCIYSCRFWSLTAIIMTALGLNKQLDLQTLLTELARAALINTDYFSARRTIQSLFVLTLGTAGIMMLTWLVRRQKGMCSAIHVATFGLLITSGYIVVRAASFHHFAASLGQQVAPAWLFPLLELTGIVLVGAGALLHSRSAPCVCHAETDAASDP